MEESANNDTDSDGEAQETSVFLNEPPRDAEVTTTQHEVNFCPPFLSFILYLAYFLGSTSAIIAVLATDGDNKCDQNLLLWSYVQLGILVLGLLVRIWTTFNRVKRPAPGTPFNFCWSMQARAGEFLQKLLNMFWFVWFVIGMVWTFNTQSCKTTAPSLYVMSLTFIIINLFIIGSCILCCIVIIVCFGVVYLVNPQAFGRRQNQGASKSEIDQIELHTYSQGLLEDEADAKCAICLGMYEVGDKLRFLPCTPKKHHFHQACVDEWLILNKHCPFCKRPITSTDTGTNATSPTDSTTDSTTSTQNPRPVQLEEEIQVSSDM